MTIRRLAAALAATAALGACTPEEAILWAFRDHPEEVRREAVDVAACESGLDPTATNGQYLGLFQMGSYHYWRFGGGSWDDPVVNAAAAESLYDEQGWQPWSCRP